MTDTDCDCSEEYGPCEEHGTVHVIREGSSLRTGDELNLIYLEDAESLAPDALSPAGKDVIERAKKDLDDHQSGVVRVDKPMRGRGWRNADHSIQVYSNGTAGTAGVTATVTAISEPFTRQ